LIVATSSFNPGSSSANNEQLFELRKCCEAVANTAPGDIQRMASLLSQMSLNYYADVRRQAQQSFLSALVAAGIGTLFFLYAAYHGKWQAGGPAPQISLIAGTLVQVISAINFFLYDRTSRQFSLFHICLDRTNRFLIANSFCGNIENRDRKDEARTELVKAVANAPTLTLGAASRKPESAPIGAGKPSA